MSDASAIRAAVMEALPNDTNEHGETPRPGQLYVPLSHPKALRLDCVLVVGARGVGKSFWTAALRDEASRNLLQSSVPDLSKIRVFAGFGPQSDPDLHPDADTFSSVLDGGAKPYDVWRAVIANQLVETAGSATPSSWTNWRSKAAWVAENPEWVSRLLLSADQKFASEGGGALFVFDALDRTSRDWRTMDDIVRDLLRVALLLKSFSRLHTKVFLREDQFDRTITDFPDASKLLSTRVDLDWQRHDLHGLLWQRLCNAPGQHGFLLRNVFREVAGREPDRRGVAWELGDDAKREGPLQRALFERLAGHWMGRDKRRGVPYIWSVGHLADGRGRTSPRSFLAAIKAAAEDTAVNNPSYVYPLHYEGIKRGVQRASQIRVQEMAEEYSWVRKIMAPLRSMTVPCEFDKITDAWTASFPDGIDAGSTDHLPPQQSDSWEGVRLDLERLGLMERMRDGRINMPDLYRVGFGLGRKGGVKAAAAAAPR